VTESIAFDQAADYYDRTRALPEDVQAQVTAVRVGELQGRGRVLEVGVGTGRMALPVAAAGVDLVGADLSEPMLRKLIDNAGGPTVVPATRADALALPFPDRIFGAAYMCHVLHLVPDWHGAVAEVLRVIEPKGRLLVDTGGFTTERGGEVGAYFSRAADGRRLRPGLTEPAELDTLLDDLGWLALEPVRIPFAIDYTVAGLLDRFASNEMSSTWSMSEDLRLRAVAETRSWAEERWGNLDAPLHEESQIVWRRYETPAPPGR
jgi:SAM-dependent methyltransferase